MYSAIIARVLLGGVLLTSALTPSSRMLTENFSIDLAGKPDTRPGTWGAADAVAQSIVFAPPAGYRVRILEIHGDFVAWPKSGTIAPGTSAEVGFGLKSTAPDGTSSANYGYDNSPVWVQDGLTAAVDRSRIAFDRSFPAGFDLGDDNTLVSQSFVAINTTGLVIHMEPTFTVVYTFVLK